MRKLAAVDVFTLVPYENSSLNLGLETVSSIFHASLNRVRDFGFSHRGSPGTSLSSRTPQTCENLRLVATVLTVL